MKKAFLSLLVVSAGLSASSDAITLYGLGSNQQLYRFDSANPSGATAVGGPLADVVDIDYRGSGVLYGMAGSGQTYSIDTSSGATSSLFMPTSALGGSVTEFDFNPAADRMRVLVGDSKNFRIVPDGISGMTAGTVVDDLSFATPMGVSIVGLGYTNPFAGTAAQGNTTALYSIGSNGFLYLHSVAPQFNTMTAVGTGLGFSITQPVGFDIGSDGTGFLTHGSDFYTVNLASGSANFVGSLGVAMNGIAVVPEPGTAMLSALAGLALLRRRRA